jgi:hypothetical protein
MDVFEAQSILLTMCAAEQLLTREELTQLRSCLQRLQGAAVGQVSEKGTQQQEQQHVQTMLETSFARFKLSFKVRL